MATPAFIKQVVSFMAVSDPFSFHFLHRANTTASKRISTAGVLIKKFRVYFEFNPEWIEGLTDPELVFVLRHEVLHLVLHHCDCRQIADPRLHKIANVAMDLAINCLIPVNSQCSPPTYKEDCEGVGYDGKPKIVKKGDVMGVFPKDYGYPDKLSYEQYFDLLMKDFPPPKGKRSSPGDGDGEGEGEGSCTDEEGLGGLKGTCLDDHEGFDESEVVAQDIRNQVANVSKSNKWGNTPGDVKALIELAQVTEINWLSKLRKEYGKFPTYALTFTTRKPHRFLGYPFPGKTINSFTNPAYVYADTSASVDDEELSKFLAETSSLARHMPVFWQCFDTDLAGDPKLITRRIKSPQFGVTGRGGTNFDAVFADAVAKKAKQIVIFSDGHAFEPDYHDYKGKILWVITDGGNDKVTSWRGNTIYLTNQK